MKKMFLMLIMLSSISGYAGTLDDALIKKSGSRDPAITDRSTFDGEKKQVDTPRQSNCDQFIAGAFGFKFGDKMTPPANAKVDTFWALIVDVTPNTPFRQFEKYRVNVTPETNQICLISAIYTADSIDTAEREYILIKDIIKQKYAGKYDIPNSSSLKGYELYKFNNRYIKVQWVKNQIKIEYYDKSLLDLAKKESETKSKSQFEAL